MIVIVCGVSGTGKSTVGKLLSEALQLPFYDADDFHSKANVAKMQSGIALTDSDRQPWLELLSQQLCQWQQNGAGAVLACSALKECYRITLASRCNSAIQWVMLTGSRELLLSRLNSRKGHFFSASLLDSQLSTLELPEYGVILDVQPPAEQLVASLTQQLQPD